MIAKYFRMFASAVTAVSLTLAVPGGVWAQPKSSGPANFKTETPIKHVVVIFQENISFDHYFATYPNAANPPGEPAFHALAGTPTVNNLLSGGLIDSNPNSTQPFRLDRTQPVTCDQNHNYAPEQTAFDKGLMDGFPAATGTGNGTVSATTPPITGQTVGSPLLPGQSGYCFDAEKGKGLVMGYYDGNTVTALWNYAQHYAMSDNSFSTTFGPSSVGAINLISGNTFEATMVPTKPNGAASSPSGLIAGDATSGALIGDARPAFDDCVNTNPQLQTTNQAQMTGNNVGNLLGNKDITWGWFAGGFAPTNGTTLPAVCGSAHTGLAGNGLVAEPDNVTTVGDYIPHHEPFEFYSDTTNQHHLRPSSPSLIGYDDVANHQYDLTDFFTALTNGNLPAVSYLKANAYQDGHAGYSDPLDEQTFLVSTINQIMASPDWATTAIIIAYDDSDGWYDHQMDPVINQSSVADDALTGPGACGTTPLDAIPGRCGYGPRQPLLVISPYAKANYVDHVITDQSSILAFIEYNWELGSVGGASNDVKAGSLLGMFDFSKTPDAASRALLLNESTGEVVKLN